MRKRPWLKKYREQKKLTGREAARQIGISHNYLFEIENGLRNPSGKLAFKIATFYDFKMDKFFEE